MAGNTTSLTPNHQAMTLQDGTTVVFDASVGQYVMYDRYGQKVTGMPGAWTTATSPFPPTTVNYPPIPSPFYPPLVSGGGVSEPANVLPLHQNGSVGVTTRMLSDKIHLGVKPQFGAQDSYVYLTVDEASKLVDMLIDAMCQIRDEKNTVDK
jgi:hypothetical protein